MQSNPSGVADLRIVSVGRQSQRRVIICSNPNEWLRTEFQGYSMTQLNRDQSNLW